MFSKLKRRVNSNSRNRKSFFYGINANVLLLGFTSLLNDASSEIINAVLPLFLIFLGAGSVVIGLVNGISDTVISIFKVISGNLSDREGKRKPLILLGYTSSSIAKFFIAFSSSWPLVLIFRPIERFGKGVREPPRDALLAETTKKSIHGKVFGIHHAFDSTGKIIGAALAFIFVWMLKLDFKTSILIAAIIAIVSLGPLFFVREKKIKPKNLPLKLGLKHLSNKFKIFLIIVTFFALVDLSYVFILLKAQTMFNSNSIALGLYLFYTAFLTISSIPAGRSSDKIGRKNAIMIGYLLFALTCIGFAFVSKSLVQMAVLFSFYGISRSFIEPNQRALASELGSKEKGTALGTFYMALGLAALPAGLIIGALWMYLGPSAAFIYSAGGALIAIIFFMMNRKLND